VNGHFEYPVSATGGKGIKLGVIELASNDQAHTQLIAVGVPTSASAAVVDQLGGGSSSAVSPATANSGSGDAPLHLIWHDPANIFVTETWDILHWTYDGFNVDAITYWHQYENELKDGWYADVGPYHSHGIDYHGAQAYDAYAETEVNYANPVFCVGEGPTYIQVNYSTSLGYFDGSRGMSYDTYDYGGCDLLLHYYLQWG
jgi:hypothetical protein